jgi:hypothetical protein
MGRSLEFGGVEGLGQHANSDGKASTPIKSRLINGPDPSHNSIGRGLFVKSKIELTHANSVFKEITATQYCEASVSPKPQEIAPMQTSATVIDFTLHRKRRQARAAAELMWAMYAARAGLAVFTAQAAPSSDTRRA